MALHVTPEDLALYKEAARRRHTQRAKWLNQRRERAWRVAREGARLLQKDFGARRVRIFGSLLQADRFDERSDVDLAAWGLDERSYLQVLACLLAIEPDISVDLIEAEDAQPRLLATIESEGLDL